MKLVYKMKINTTKFLRWKIADTNAHNGVYKREHKKLNHQEHVNPNENQNSNVEESYLNFRIYRYEMFNLAFWALH